ncbi:hypothetical protein ACFX2A_020260 [Malus domestica]
MAVKDRSTSFSFSPTVCSDPVAPEVEVPSHHAFLFRGTFSCIHRQRALQNCANFSVLMSIHQTKQLPDFVLTVLEPISTHGMTGTLSESYLSCFLV